jgi:release factor glutamine methyltransferase
MSASPDPSAGAGEGEPDGGDGTAAKAAVPPLQFLPDTRRGDALAALRRAFIAAGLDTPSLDARVLACAALGADTAEIAARPDAPLGAAAGRLDDFARRRLAREPVGRILGRREFWGLTFELSPDTLEPRPDTETLVETALRVIPHPNGALRILDLGTGSGCLLVALLHELPDAFGLGVDRSPGALATARRNALRNGVGARAGFIASDWGAAIRGRFELIVSNPPYIPSPDLPGLAAEVRDHDPSAALDGGDDGLAAYRAILAQAPALMAAGGVTVVEIGLGQEQAVRDLAGGAGLAVDSVARDLAGHPRAVVLKGPQS